MSKRSSAPSNVVDLDAYRARVRAREVDEARGRLLYERLQAEARAVFFGEGGVFAAE